MTHDTGIPRAAQARALILALAIAAKADWQLQRAGAALSTPFSSYLYVDSAQLLLVPTSAGLPFARRLVGGAILEARSDALIVSTAGAEPAFALGLWASSSPRWQSPVMPLLDEFNALWMVAQATAIPGAAPAGTAFPMQRGRLVDRPAPWTTLENWVAGADRATAWLGAIIGGASSVRSR